MRNAPGITTMVVMPSGATSLRSEKVIASSAALIMPTAPKKLVVSRRATLSRGVGLEHLGDRVPGPDSGGDGGQPR